MNNSNSITSRRRFPRVGDPSTGIDQKTYANLVLYTKYASASYMTPCPRPLGNTLVGEFTNIVTAMHGFVARDDKRNEIVVSIRGTKEVSSILIGVADASVMLTPLQGIGLPPSTSQESSEQPRVHTGFLVAYQSIAHAMLNVLGPQIDAYSTYRVIATGHSLGVSSYPRSLCVCISLFIAHQTQGAIASIASIAIRNSYPRTSISLYTIGQPRTGDLMYAALVEKMIGVENIYRGVHSIDGVPTMIPMKFGYRHHATEYWQFTELSTSEHVKRCEGGEDPEGSGSIPSSGVNPAHWVYFGQRGSSHCSHLFLPSTLFDSDCI
ncbi:Alpha/Beta hydrolase protein [Scleroderma citrinum]